MLDPKDFCIKEKKYQSFYDLDQRYFKKIGYRRPKNHYRLQICHELENSFYMNRKNEWAKLDVKNEKNKSFGKLECKIELFSLED